MGSEDVSISKKNYPQYIEQYGLERAMGYRDAIRDILEDLFKMDPNKPVPLTAQRASTMAFKFQNEKIELLETILMTLKPHINKNSSDPDQKYTL